LQAVAFVRLDDQALFDADDVARVQLLVPHIARAIEVAERLNTLEVERHDVLAAIDSLSVGILIVDGRPRLRQANLEASRLLSDGLFVSAIDGVVAFADTDLNRVFRKAFEDGGIQPLTLTLGDGTPLRMSLLPQRAAPSGDDGRRALLVFYLQSMPASSGGDVLKARFGFTTAELRVLLMLMEGGTRESIAEDLGLSLAIVKTQLQALFRKTGTSRQPDLILQVMGAIAVPATLGAVQKSAGSSPK
jgi:DNA-binding CsgD family transcriptional regulator